MSVRAALILASLLGGALGDGCWLDCDQADADGAAAICASEGGALCSPYEMLADEATRSTSECHAGVYAWTDDDSFTWSSESLSWSCGAGERLACVSNGHPASTDCACYDESTQLDVRCCNCDGNDYAMAGCATRAAAGGPKSSGGGDALPRGCSSAHQKRLRTRREGTKRLVRATKAAPTPQKPLAKPVSYTHLTLPTILLV